MTDQEGDARAALDMVTQSRRRASEFRHYAEAGPPLMAWGATWLAGNLAAQFAPAEANLVWLVGIAGAVLFTLISSRKRADGRIMATVATAYGFAVLLMAMINGGTRIQIALAALLVAAIYIVVGIWTGKRLIWVGIVMAITVVVGWFVVPAWFYLCLAFGGGGALLISGWWLRRA